MKTAARSYVLTIVIGFVLGLVVAYVHEQVLFPMLPVALVPRLILASFVCMALIEGIVAVLVLWFVTSRRRTIVRTFEGVVLGVLYALSFSAAYALMAYSFGVFSPAFAGASVIARLVCGVLLGAAVGQACLARSYRDESSTRKFFIAGFAIWVVFQGISELLAALCFPTHLLKVGPSYSAGVALFGSNVTIMFVVVGIIALVLVVLALRASIRHKRFNWDIGRR